jgi:hypothetical protein
MSPNPLSSVVIVYTSDGCIVMANRLVSGTAAQGLAPFIHPSLPHNIKCKHHTTCIRTNTAGSKYSRRAKNDKTNKTPFPTLSKSCFPPKMKKTR